jgi:hypothetical protein
LFHSQRTTPESVLRPINAVAEARTASDALPTAPSLRALV